MNLQPPARTALKPPRTRLALGLLFLAAAGFVLYWFLLKPESTARAEKPLTKEGIVPAYMGKSWKEMDDPTADGWDTEVVSSLTDKILKKIGEALTKPAALADAHLDK